MKRRTLLGLLVAAGSAVAAGAVVIPTLIAGLSPVWQPRRETWRSLGRLPRFPIGEVTLAFVTPARDVWPRPYGGHSVFVWRPNEAEIVVFSRSCTDLGCSLEHEPGSGCFLCPCHGGIFAQDGRRLAGPPSSPMLRYADRVREGMLEIDIASIPPTP